MTLPPKLRIRMPEPTDQKLYDLVKKNVYKEIPKHSAYRSGIVVQKYKKSFKKKYGAKRQPYKGKSFSGRFPLRLGDGTLLFPAYGGISVKRDWGPTDCAVSMWCHRSSTAFVLNHSHHTIHEFLT